MSVLHPSGPEDFGGSDYADLPPPTDTRSRLRSDADEVLSPRPSRPRIACVYIAGPFSGKDGWEIAENVHAANRLAREVARMGAMPMTPHAIGAQMAGTETQDFWLAATLEMMRRCDAVLFTDDWQRSTGARGEHAEAVRRGMPVFYGLTSLAVWLGDRR